MRTIWKSTLNYRDGAYATVLRTYSVPAVLYSVFVSPISAVRCASLINIWRWNSWKTHKQYLYLATHLVITSGPPPGDNNISNLATGTVIENPGKKISRSKIWPKKRISFRNPFHHIFDSPCSSTSTASNMYLPRKHIETIKLLLIHLKAYRPPVRPCGPPNRP